ncbi:MAG: Mov34/MPN/PAD-1 family protein [Promethearchaeota archaeon]
MIKKQALSSEDEIYGWLIGYKLDDIPNVLAIVECQKFEQQTLISAIPDAKEFQKISSIMPQGIGPIGIYHSHPISSKIFHSHTDDATLKSLSNQFPNCISIVTNGKEIEFYQMGRNKKVKSLNVQYEQPDILNFLLFTIDEDITVFINRNILNNLKEKGTLKIRISNFLREYFEKIWDNFEFNINGKSISKKLSVEVFLNNKLINKTIQLNIPENQNKFTQNLTISENHKGIGQSEFQNDLIPFSLNLKATTPIYISDRIKNFEEINEIIKTEILSNNIAKKLYDSIINFKNNEIIIPEDQLLHYFNFFIRIHYFKDKKLNTNSISSNILDILNNLLAIAMLNDDFELDKGLEYQIKIFIEDIEPICKYFDWEEKMKTTLINIKKQFKTK